MWWKSDDSDDLVATFAHEEPAKAWAEKWYGSPERSKVDGRLYWYVMKV